MKASQLRLRLRLALIAFGIWMGIMTGFGLEATEEDTTPGALAGGLLLFAFTFAGTLAAIRIQAYRCKAQGRQMRNEVVYPFWTQPFFSNALTTIHTVAIWFVATSLSALAGMPFRTDFPYAAVIMPLGMGLGPIAAFSIAARAYPQLFGRPGDQPDETLETFVADLSKKLQHTLQFNLLPLVAYGLVIASIILMISLLLYFLAGIRIWEIGE